MSPTLKQEKHWGIIFVRKWNSNLNEYFGPNVQGQSPAKHKYTQEKDLQQHTTYKTKMKSF